MWWMWWNMVKKRVVQTQPQPTPTQSQSNPPGLYATQATNDEELTSQEVVKILSKTDEEEQETSPGSQPSLSQVVGVRDFIEGPLQARKDEMKENRLLSSPFP